jgi:hypothetical protein
MSPVTFGTAALTIFANKRKLSGSTPYTSCLMATRELAHNKRNEDRYTFEDVSCKFIKIVERKVNKLEHHHKGSQIFETVHRFKQSLTSN